MATAKVGSDADTGSVEESTIIQAVGGQGDGVSPGPVFTPFTLPGETVRISRQPALVAEGAIHHDEKLTRRGYYALRDSIDAWPEFNLFTAGYVLSGQPAASARFKEGLEWQWQTLDKCSGVSVNRQDPDFAPYMTHATTSGAKRVCWNSEIAPHNFEGFFLNMGDMLVKSGDWQVARKVYANARLSPAYDAWGYKEVLEGRIRDAAANATAFNAPAGPKGNGMMQRSAYACMACHQI